MTRALRDLANRATIREASSLFGIRRETLRKAVRDGHLPARKQTGRLARGSPYAWILDLAEVEAWLDARPGLAKRKRIAEGKAMLKRGWTTRGVAQHFGVTMRAVQRWRATQ